MDTLPPALLSPFSVLFFSKIVIAFILGALLYNLLHAGKYGRLLSRTHKREKIKFRIYAFDVSQKSREYRKLLTTHEKYAKRCFWIVLLAVAVIEPTVRCNHPVYDALFWIHLCVFAIPCFILLALVRFKYTGLKRPDVHGKFIYWGLLPTLIGTLLTGIPLLYRL